VDPTALYLDEPTSGLSSSDSMLIMKAMWSLLHLQVRCVFCSSEGAALRWEQNTCARHTHTHTNLY
jgi:energy-coupling factor transporter ATP-binding protein EcfA2